MDPIDHHILIIQIYKSFKVGFALNLPNMVFVFKLLIQKQEFSVAQQCHWRFCNANERKTSITF